MRRPSNDILFDTRLIERHLRKGMVTREEVQQHLESIQDVSEQAEVLAFDDLASDRQSHQEQTGGDSGEAANG